MMHGANSCGQIPLLWPGSQGSQSPHSPLLASPRGNTHLLALGTRQASVTLGALPGGEQR